MKTINRHKYLCTVHWAMLKTGSTVVRRGPGLSQCCEYPDCRQKAFVQVY